MGGFVLGAVLLVAATLLLLLRPWRRARDAAAATTAGQVNAALYRSQLDELERDLAAGTLAAADAQQARLELQRRLLDDTAPQASATAPSSSTGRRTALTLALAVPLFAAGLYVWLGTPAALQPQQAAAQPAAAENEMERMVAALAARLQAKPDDPVGWGVLARSYRAMGRIEEAQHAFERIGEPLWQDPLLLAAYADVLATRAGGNLEGKPLELVTRALALDPAQPLALALVANAAEGRSDFALATQHWQRLLALLPPGSDDARWVEQRLAQLRAQGAAPAAPASGASALAARSIHGRVSLSPALAARAQPTDTVFVYAVLPEGPRMPLAVRRARVADLPLDFVLDDSLSLSPQHKLSGADQVRVEARISRSGDAMPAAGDLFGTSKGLVRPGDGAPISLQIDSVRP